MVEKIVLATIEDPRGSKKHVEFDKVTQQYKTVQEFLIPWPFHYGFIKNTYVPVDGDPLDIAVFGDFQTCEGQNIQVRVIGALLVQDGDHKVVAIDPSDRQFGSCAEYNDLPESLRIEGENIFKKGGHVIEKTLTSEEAVNLIACYQIKTQAQTQ